jgi:hypothetical protein
VIEKNVGLYLTTPIQSTIFSCQKIEKSVWSNSITKYSLNAHMSETDSEESICGITVFVFHTEFITVSVRRTIWNPLMHT